jgi:hypothetical protein
MIWSEMDTCSAAACVNTAMHEEVQRFTYDNLCVTFEQHPTKTLFSSVTTNRGIPLKPIGPLDSDLPHWLHCLPWSRVQCLKFKVLPPSTDDAGQLINMWLTITRLLDVLTLCTGNLPPVQICILNAGTWSPCESTAGITDLESALLPFLRLHCVANLSVKDSEQLLPSPCADGEDGKADDASKRISVMENKSTGVDASDSCEDFGDFKGHGSTGDSITRLQMLVQGITNGAKIELVNYFQVLRHLQMHSQLDNLTGPTAAILRRDRFANWSRDYECTHRHRLKCGGILPKIEIGRLRSGRFFFNAPPEEFYQGCEDFEKLYLEMRAWNPWSVVLYEAPDADAGTDEWDIYNAIDTQQNFTGEYSLVYDGFSARSWARLYPEGLSPRSSTEYQDFVRDHREPDLGLVVLTPRGIILEKPMDEIPVALGGEGGLDDVEAREARTWLSLGLPNRL